jgi:hypothetical protein
MAASDLLVCSVSSLSMLAGFLGAQHYLWYRPQLTDVDGELTIWGHQPEKGPAMGSAGSGRRLPCNEGDQLPGSIAVGLTESLPSWQKCSDLLYYGTVGKSPSAPFPSGLDKPAAEVAP